MRTNNQAYPRPSINNDIPYPIELPEVKNYNVNFLINRAVPEGSKTFENWYKNIGVLTPDVWKIIVQTLCACYTMALCKMTHNDLHSDNVWVVPVKSKFLYMISDSDKIYMNVSYVSLVYDFDRSYVESLGPNLLLSGYDKYCGDFSQCNQFIPNKDMVKFLCYVYRSTKNQSDKEKILSLLTIDPGIRKELVDSYNINGCFLQTSIYKLSLLNSFYSKLFSPKKILMNAAVNIRDVIPTDISDVHIFNMREHQFRADGSLKPIKELEHIRKLEYKINILESQLENDCNKMIE